MRNIRPPLPFCDYKGHWGAELTEIARKLPKNCTVFDVFGGSGICAHYIKQARPDLDVVWNDFDNYRARLRNADKTERLRLHFLETLGRPVPKGEIHTPLTPERRQFVFDTIKQQLADFGFVDHQTVSRWFYLYSMKTYKLVSSTGKLYNRLPVVPIRLDACAGWLRDVLPCSVTFSGIDTPFKLPSGTVRPRDFIPSQNALFVFAPPYLGTACNDYGNQEALKVLRSICECCEHLPFLLFGDASISFWYELIFKGRHVRRYEKTINNIGLNHQKRSEILFACLPGEG